MSVKKEEVSYDDERGGIMAKLRIENKGGYYSWEDCLDPNSADAIHDFGWPVALRVDGSINQSRSLLLGSEDGVRKGYALAQFCLQTMAELVMSQTERLRDGVWIELEALKAARIGNLREVEVWLRGEPESQRLRVIRSLALLSTITANERRHKDKSGYQGKLDLLCAASAEMALTLVRDPGFMGKFFRVKAAA